MVTLKEEYGVKYVDLGDGWETSLFFELEGEVCFGPDAGCEEMRRDLTPEEGAQIKALCHKRWPNLKVKGIYW